MKLNKGQVIIAALIVTGFFAVAITVLAKPEIITEKNTEAVMLLIGALVSGFATIIGFFFGSSLGSAKKTELLARAEPVINLEDSLDAK